MVASPFTNLAPLYEVDPEADVLLIVPSSNKPFAPWVGAPQVNGTNGVHKTTAAAAPASRPGLRIKVSSRHLTLASRVFKNKLQFSSSKGTRQSDGRVHLKLSEGFDPQAVSIVLNAVHARGSKVPRSVDLETLAQIAIFVDRFQLLDAVEVYAERWISKLEGDIPETYNRDLVLWLYISHVFRHSDIFKAVSKTAAAQSHGPIQTLNLPIREKIISRFPLLSPKLPHPKSSLTRPAEHIDTQRQLLLSKALTQIHNALDELTSGSTVAPCATHHCDALLLGELVKSLSRQRLVWPRPAKPFAGISFASVVDGVIGGLTLLQAQRRRDREEVEPWYMKGAGANGHGEGNGANGARKLGWGVVGGVFPITPAASPEPVFRNRGHECDARRVVARLEGLERLEQGVEGLVLESGLGYQRY